MINQDTVELVATLAKTHSTGEIAKILFRSRRVIERFRQEAVRQGRLEPRTYAPPEETFRTVIALTMRGMSARAIANRLNCARQTVVRYRTKARREGLL